MNSDSSSPSLLFILFCAAVIVLMIVSCWKIFQKAGQPGWACLIPIYNVYILIQIARRPGWWLLLFLVPGVNLIVEIIVFIDIAKSFGKGVGFAIGLILLPFIFYPILAFGDASYRSAEPPPIAPATA